jgi:hypothetical protein
MSSFRKMINKQRDDTVDLSAVDSERNRIENQLKEAQKEETFFLTHQHSGNIALRYLEPISLGIGETLAEIATDSTTKTLSGDELTARIKNKIQDKLEDPEIKSNINFVERQIEGLDIANIVNGEIIQTAIPKIYQQSRAGDQTLSNSTDEWNIKILEVLKKKIPPLGPLTEELGLKLQRQIKNALAEKKMLDNVVEFLDKGLSLEEIAKKGPGYRGFVERIGTKKSGAGESPLPW